VGRSLIRYALTVRGSEGHPVFDCCVSQLRNFEMFEENVGAASPKIAAVDGFGLPYA
jgi:hypothetical protein